MRKWHVFCANTHSHVSYLRQTDFNSDSDAAQERICNCQIHTWTYHNEEMIETLLCTKIALRLKSTQVNKASWHLWSTSQHFPSSLPKTWLTELELKAITEWESRGTDRHGSLLPRKVQRYCFHFLVSQCQEKCKRLQIAFTRASFFNLWGSLHNTLNRPYGGHLLELDTREGRKNNNYYTIFFYSHPLLSLSMRGCWVNVCYIFAIPGCCGLHFQTPLFCTVLAQTAYAFISALKVGIGKSHCSQIKI